MPKFPVEIAELVRQTATILVEAPSKEALEDALGAVYSAESDQSCAEWVSDYEWGAEEGTHAVHDQVEDTEYAHFTLSETGEVSYNAPPKPSVRMSTFLLSEAANCESMNTEPTLGAAHDSLQQMPDEILVQVLGEHAEPWADHEGRHRFSRKSFEHEFANLLSAHGSQKNLYELLK